MTDAIVEERKRLEQERAIARGKETDSDSPDWKHSIQFYQLLTSVWDDTTSVEETILYYLPTEAIVPLLLI